MRERAQRYLAGIEKARAIVAGDPDPYPQLVLRTIDRLAPIIADMMASEANACPHCLALALENFVVSPAVSALNVGFSPRLKGKALQAIIDIKCAALGFECVDTTDDVPPLQSGGLH